MYAGKFKAPHGGMRVRANFDTLGSAILTVFVVASGENWDVVLDYAFRANGYVGMVFVVSMYLVGNFIVVNIFLAVLLSNFEMAVDEQHGTIFESLEESNELVLSVRSAAASARRVFVMVRLRARSSKACRWHRAARVTSPRGGPS